MEPFQAIVVVLAVFFLSRAVLRFRDKQIRMGELAFWLVVWLSIIFLVLTPTTIARFSRSLGVSRPVDLALMVAVMVLLYAVFRLNVRIDGMERSITRIVSEEAKRRAK